MTRSFFVLAGFVTALCVIAVFPPLLLVLARSRREPQPVAPSLPSGNPLAAYLAFVSASA